MKKSKLVQNLQNSIIAMVLCIHSVEILRRIYRYVHCYYLDD